MATPSPRQADSPHQRPSVRDRLEPVRSAWRPLLLAWMTLFIVVVAFGLLLVDRSAMLPSERTRQPPDWRISRELVHR